ncbi:GNAT family N-acetyltransferase [Brevibacterium sp. UMB1308A]|uniref:GNAT family N-acetyltransferase n=1 Tax=Brevibacterium sp. UMB1308A TaxID=3050608 RepID=UPI00254CD693|nr:GNAT family N-acetyltransferase [Brevibacterium sp. UMB1308A]MDK8345720.1 GNAT family N-acetyltransferase [Brevibacterium sp. UMB1308B]MDK8713159.1 GNAT family N-acetyltransferase [Brevibacterium sp. UMB1308A]
MAQAHSIVRVTPDDWSRVRAIRLASLKDAPAAFSGSYERESQVDEAKWRQRLQTLTIFMCVKQGHDIGFATFTVRDGYADLGGTWVHPAHRGHGAVDALTNAVFTEAQRAGYTEIQLRVFEENQRAIGAYLRSGFRMTGEIDRLPDGREAAYMVRKFA